VGTLLARRHYTPGQRAYLIADVIEEAWELAREREEANRRQNFQAMIHGANAVQSVENQALTSKMSQNLEASWLRPTGIFNAERRAEEVAQTVGAYAQRLGISLRLLQMAREIWELYRAYPQKFTWSPEVLKLRGLPAGTQLTLREYFEPLVLDDEDPMGLGRVKEGIAQKVWQARREAEGMRHCGRADVLRDNQRQLRLFYQLWSSFRVRACEYWPKLPPEAKVEVCNKLINAAEAMPEEFVSQVAAIFQRELNRRRKQRERERKQQHH
ncbi:MAG: hypothetical protein RMK20_16140, partial [Verrucomicrobiales bacterium]|nr:hypothetical protein [Verrucomicrobiales bacterium]